ncbi:MAG: SGNH/GDSL hydrolase family protein [Clostridia bacterium]|nr:SGNH/GDSL hydrolase family protein [Clostridia bacterium]
MKKISFVLAVLLILCTLFTSCVKEQEEGNSAETTTAATTASEEILPILADFSIVREDNCSSGVTELVKELKSKIKLATECELSLKTDIVEETSYEILIGNARGVAESAVGELSNNGYAVKTVRSDGEIKIIIAGKSEFALSTAVDIFLEQLKSSDINALLSLDLSGDALRDTPKTISVFGDSITTYLNYSNNASANATLANNGGGWYNSSRMSVRETWWMRTADGLSLDLCVNNARSGDWCASEYALERSQNLHTDSGEYPDVIVVYFGINDYHQGSSTAKFKTDYTKIIQSIRDTYPDANIFCCTLLPRHAEASQNQKIVSYNGIIKETAETVGTELIDLYALIGDDYMANLTAYTYDQIHPNATGMEKMSGAIVGEISKWIEENCKQN